MNPDNLLHYFDVPGLIPFIIVIISLVAIAVAAMSGRPMFGHSVVYCTSSDASQVHLDPLHIPFFLNVLGDNRDRSQEAAANTNIVVRCELKSEVPCTVKYLWKIPFPHLSHILNAVTAADAALYQSEIQSFDPGEHTTEASYQGEGPLEEPAGRPKSHYPLVAVVETTFAPGSPNDVEALIVVVHVRDSVNTMATSALHRYVRQANGRVTLLQPLYPSGVDQEEEDQDQEAGSLGACCVCHSAPASVVLLPCRHGCVCQQCFPRTDACPLCRARVAQFFTVPQRRPAQEDGTSEDRQQAGTAEEASRTGVVRRPAREASQ